jgi:hypothetical protein
MRKLPQTLYRWIKIITATLFVLIGLYNDQSMILIALILFFLGDVILAFADGGKVKRWLLLGMLFFWMGHIGLIMCMLTVGTLTVSVFIIGLTPVLLLVFIRQIYSNIDFRGMFNILMGYAYTLGILTSLSVLTYDTHPQLTWGIFVFLISDICLIFWYFYPRCPRWVKVINVLTYFGSVLIIALS